MLLVLVGPGGSGKSRVAALLVAEFGFRAVENLSGVKPGERAVVALTDHTVLGNEYPVEGHVIVFDRSIGDIPDDLWDYIPEMHTRFTAPWEENIEVFLNTARACFEAFLGA